MNEIKAQEYINKNFTDRSVKVINLLANGEKFSKSFLENYAEDGQIAVEGKLTEDIIIQDFPNLEEVTLPNHELTSLTIINCPQLGKINVRHNQLTKLEINGENQISEIIVGQNELTTLDLTNCPNLKKLMLPDNPYLTEIKGLNLTTIKDINITNTALNLAADYENLKQEYENLLQSVKVLKEGGEEGKLVLTEAIQNNEQLKEAIRRHLKEVEKRWRYYFDNPAEALPSFQIPTIRKKAQQILILIKKSYHDGDYQALVKEWKGSSGEDNDFDGSLEQLEQYLRVQNHFREKDQTKNLVNYESRQ